MLRKNSQLRGGRIIKVNIEQLQAAADVFGAPATAWQTFAAGVPARLQNVSAMERYGDQQIEAIERFDVVMRYRKGITEKMRLSFTNDTKPYLLDIEAVDNVDFRNRTLVLRCKSGVNRG